MAIQQNQPGEAEPTWQSVNVYALIQAFRTEYDAHMSGGNAYVAYSLVTYSEGPDLFLRGLEALLGSRRRTSGGCGPLPPLSACCVSAATGKKIRRE
jgi:hypothetical protein